MFVTCGGSLGYEFLLLVIKRGARLSVLCPLQGQSLTRAIPSMCASQSGGIAIFPRLSVRSFGLIPLIDMMRSYPIAGARTPGLHQLSTAFCSVFFVRGIGYEPRQFSVICPSYPQVRIWRKSCVTGSTDHNTLSYLLRPVRLRAEECKWRPDIGSVALDLGRC